MLFPSVSVREIQTLEEQFSFARLVGTCYKFRPQTFCFVAHVTETLCTCFMLYDLLVTYVIFLGGL